MKYFSLLLISYRARRANRSYRGAAKSDPTIPIWTQPTILHVSCWVNFFHSNMDPTYHIPADYLESQLLFLAWRILNQIRSDSYICISCSLCCIFNVTFHFPVIHVQCLIFSDDNVVGARNTNGPQIPIHHKQKTIPNIFSLCPFLEVENFFSKSIICSPNQLKIKC